MDAGNLRIRRARVDVVPRVLRAGHELLVRDGERRRQERGDALLQLAFG